MTAKLSSPILARVSVARTQLSTSVDSPPDRLRLPGLHPQRRYEVRMAGPSASTFRREPVLVHRLSGQALAEVGIEWGPQRPETTALVAARSLDGLDAAPGSLR